MSVMKDEKEAKFVPGQTKTVAFAATTATTIFTTADILVPLVVMALVLLVIAVAAPVMAVVVTVIAMVVAVVMAWLALATATASIRVHGTNRIAQVVSLHLHPKNKGGPIYGGSMTSVSEMELVKDKGIRGNDRYFDRKTSKGEPSPRQVSLIDRSIIKYHEEQVGIGCLPAGAIRSNIETAQVNLNDGKHEDRTPAECPYTHLLHRQLKIGSVAIIELTLTRTPCWEMDVLSNGLQQSMKGDRQGVLAKVVQSGTVKIGDPVFLI